MSGWDMAWRQANQPIQQMQGGVAQPMGIELNVADPRGTGGAQQQNPYDSLKKLFGENLQKSGGGLGGGLQDLFGRIGQQTGQMRDQGPPNIYETSIYRTNQGPNRPMPSRPGVRQPQGPEQPLRNGDTFNRRIQEQMGQRRGRLPQEQVGFSPLPRQRMPQPNQGYGNRFPGMQFSGPFSQPMMPQNYGMGGGYRQPPMVPQYPQPRMPYPQPMPQPGYGGGFGGRGPGGGYGNMYAQQPQMYGGGYNMPQRPPMFGGGFGGMQGGYGQQPQFGGGFGGGMQGGMQVGYGMQGGYGGGMGGMYNQPQRQPQYQNAGPSPFGGQMNQRQQPQQMGGGFQQMGGFGGGIMRSFY